MLNITVLEGRITKDPEVKMAGNSECCNFTLAVNRRFAKEGQQDVDYIDCVCWGSSAKFLGSYVKKGYLLSVEGRLQKRSYDGQNGKVYVTEVVCDSVNNLTPKNDSKPKQATQTNFLDAEPLNYNTVPVEPDDLPFY